MPEGVQLPDGEKLDLDPGEQQRITEDFARAMTAPAGDDKAPPKRAEKPEQTKTEPPRVRRGPGRPRKTSDGSKSAPAPVQGLSKEVRVEGVKGLVQLAAGGCLLGSQAVKAPGAKVAFKADAVTLASSADQLAEAVAATCEADEKFARLVDKVCAVGPYGALLSAVAAVGTQLARNHGAPVPGTHDPADLVAMAEAQESAPAHA